MPRHSTCDCGNCRKCRIRFATAAWRVRQQADLDSIRVPRDQAEEYENKALRSHWDEYASAVKVMIVGSGGGN